MIRLSDWLDKNIDKLSEEYDEYLRDNDNSVFIPLEFDEYVQDKYDSTLGDYMDMKYQEFRERDI